MVEVIVGSVLDEGVELTFREVCRICGAGEETVIEMVREGVVEIASPARLSRRGRSPAAVAHAAEAAAQWVFSGAAVTRIQMALRLQRDLHVNLAGVALALDLLDEIERLKRRAAQ